MTRAGRRLAVCESEFGNKTSTTSPRLAFIVDGGFGTFPIFSESFQARAQISGLDFINATIMQYHRRIFGRDFRQLPAHDLKFRRRQLGQFIDDLGYTHVFNLVCTGKIATANSVQYGSGNLAVNSRTRLRTLCAASNPIFLEIFVSVARNRKVP
jgi:hypothetical protein